MKVHANKKRAPRLLLKETLFASFLFWQLTGMEPAAAGSWLIDPAKFHVSAHGQISCQDCHDRIASKEFHPDPADVVRRQGDFFQVDQCLSCHDDIVAKLDQGLHGKTMIGDAGRYRACLDCHNPHDQLSIGESRISPSKSTYEQCGACHGERTSLPGLSAEDQACMNCHGLITPGGPEAGERISRLCFHCHGNEGTRAQKLTEASVSPIDEAQYGSTAHAGIACTVCHPQAAQFRHHTQKSADCRGCHLRHDEKVAHDAHPAVACEACHLGSISPVLDPDSNRLLWQRQRTPGQVSGVHRMVGGEDESSCRRCHFRGNRVGAASMVLPPKSILCMPCHTATFSIGDTTTVLALVFFLIGFTGVSSYWLSGSIPGKEGAGALRKFLDLAWRGIRSLFSRRIFPILEALLLDVLLQRRLFRQSVSRWFIHGLIFFPFAIRFTWGMIALIASLWSPQAEWFWPMLDRNDPLTAVLFDLTGIMVILGVVLALLRGFVKKPGTPAGVPRQDRFSLILIGSVVLAGFLVEGMRIAMMGFPRGSIYAVAGYGIGKIFSDPEKLTDVYGYVWYLHAILTGAFIAYLPFSRLLHIIVAPLVLVMRTVEEHEDRQK